MDSERGKTKARPKPGTARRPSVSAQSETRVRTPVREPETQTDGVGGDSRPPPDRQRDRPPRSHYIAADRTLIANETVPNPLVEAALPVFDLVVRLRHKSSATQVQHHRDQVAQLVDDFERVARRDAANDTTIQECRFALYTLADEVAYGTAWGQSSWQSLMREYFKTDDGGRAFYQRLDVAAQAVGEPTTRALVEFYFVCMCLGLRGVLGDRPQEFEQKKDRVYRLLRRYPGNLFQIAPDCQGATDVRPKLSRVLPGWAAIAIALGAALVVYIALGFRLGARADTTTAEIRRLQANFGPVALVRFPPIASDLLGLRRVLPDEADHLQVTEVPGRSTVSLRGLFESGEGSLSEAQRARIARVADALAKFAGPIEVTGHTDNRPFAAHASGNAGLSKKRAEYVRTLLAEKLGEDRLRTAEGRADSEPVGPNETEEGRALNRRVEITLLPAPRDL